MEATKLPVPVYLPHTRVTVAPLQVGGVVDIIRWDGLTWGYYVNYWYDGVRKGEWLTEDELE